MPTRATPVTEMAWEWNPFKTIQNSKCKMQNSGVRFAHGFSITRSLAPAAPLAGSQDCDNVVVDNKGAGEMIRMPSSAGSGRRHPTFRKPCSRVLDREILRHRPRTNKNLSVPPGVFSIRHPQVRGLVWRRHRRLGIAIHVADSVAANCLTNTANMAVAHFQETMLKST